MVYFNFNYVTNPPADEFVDVDTQLNNNWTEVDNKLKPFNQKPSDFTGITIPKGTVAFNPTPGSETRMAVWNGSTWKNSVSQSGNWSSWADLGIRSPTVIRSGFTPRWRFHTGLKKVELVGGVQFDGAASAWPTGSTIEITSDSALNTTYLPANTAQASYRQGAVGQITTANGFASAVILIESKSSPSRTAVSVRYQGDAGGGNFIMLDGISWWYS